MFYLCFAARSARSATIEMVDVFMIHAVDDYGDMRLRCRELPILSLISRRAFAARYVLMLPLRFFADAASPICRADAVYDVARYRATMPLPFARCAICAAMVILMLCSAAGDERDARECRQRALRRKSGARLLSSP